MFKKNDKESTTYQIAFSVDFCNAKLVAIDFDEKVCF